MPYRVTPLVTGEIYHVFNRSINKVQIFNDAREYAQMLNSLKYYQFQKPKLPYSNYKILDQQSRIKYFKNLINQSDKLIEVLCYCLMPNHIHLLIKQLTDDGISNYLRKVQNSYAKYYNTKHQRTGSLWQSPFKSVRIETEEQLKHISRYIHLNPVTAYLTNIDKLEKYAWNSYKDYINNPEIGEYKFTNTELILGLFSRTNDYKLYLYNQVDYQRKLSLIKHLKID